MKNNLIIHTDGGSRGNPGPAACAFVADVNEKEVFSESKFLGIQTNNYAEYQGVILALEWLISSELISNDSLLITFLLDSELVVKQLNDVYRVKDKGLKKLFLKTGELIKNLDKKIFFKSVPREKNKTADSLVNKELDACFKRHSG